MSNAYITSEILKIKPDMSEPDIEGLIVQIMYYTQYKRTINTTLLNHLSYVIYNLDNTPIKDVTLKIQGKQLNKFIATTLKLHTLGFKFHYITEPHTNLLFKIKITDALDMATEITALQQETIKNAPTGLYMGEDLDWEHPRDMLEFF